MPGEAYRYLVELAMHGKLKPGTPRFDPSAIESITFEDRDIIFNLGTTKKQFLLDDLTQDEANIAYDYLTKKYDREGWEEEGKSILDPRPWMKPKWYLKATFYIGLAFVAVIWIIMIALSIISAGVNHESQGPTWVPDYVNDPQFREMKNFNDAVSIVENDPLYKEVSIHGVDSSSSGGSVNPASKGYLNYTGRLYEVHMDTKGQPPYHFEALVDIDNRTVLNITRMAYVQK